MEKGTAAKRIEQEIKANDFETIKDNVWKLMYQAASGVHIGVMC